MDDWSRDPYAAPDDPYRDDPRYPSPAFGPPGYGPAHEIGAGPYGYGPPGYPSYGYLTHPVAPTGTVFPPRIQRPGSVTAANVLGYVAGGLLALASLVLFLGAVLVSSVSDAYYDEGVGYSTQFAVGGVIDLIAAGLLVGGAIALGRRRPTGRLVYTLGALIVLADSVCWLVQWSGTSGGAVVFYALLFAALAVVGVFLAWTNAVTAWLAHEEPAPPLPTRSA